MLIQAQAKKKKKNPPIQLRIERVIVAVEKEIIRFSPFLFSLLARVFDLLDQRQFQFLIDYINGINPINSHKQTSAGSAAALNMFYNQSGGRKGRKRGVDAFHLFIPLHPTNDLSSVFTHTYGAFSQEGLCKR